MRSQHYTMRRKLVRLENITRIRKEAGDQIPVLSQGTFREQLVVCPGRPRG